MKSCKIFIFIFCLQFILGCSTTTRQFDPDLLVELRGAIRTEKNAYQVGEPIVVTYTISNGQTLEWQEKVINGSKEEKVPFVGYSFNATLEADRSQSLELQNAGVPFQGDLKLAPNADQTFCQNTFIAKQPGNYLLSFDLRWKDNKKIAFKPVTIHVQEKKEATKVTPEDMELQATIQDLASPSVEVQIAAREKLKAMGEKVIIPLVVRLSDTQVQKHVTSLLEDIGKPAVPYLIAQAVRNPSPEVRMRAIYILGQIGDMDALSTIHNAVLQDPDSDVRQTALRLVRDFTEIIAVPLLIQALDDKHLPIRVEAYDMLKKMTVHDITFIPDGTMEQRQGAIAEWKKWWQKTDPNAFP